MFRLLVSVFQLLVSLANIKELALENLALRQQRAVMKRRRPRLRLQVADRIFWVWLSTVWSPWRQALMIVRPETVVSWHRKGFRLFWSWISRRQRSGRPEVSTEIRALIRQMAESNPFWGAPRIHGELLKLGLEVSERTVSRLMPKSRKPPSQTWRAFLNHHVEQLVLIDFFAVPTATFRVLFVLVVLAHHRRRLIHFNVTEHPTALWTAQQIVEAFPDDTARRYLLRDRDQIYGEDFHERVQGM
jgi:putative transposase